MRQNITMPGPETELYGVKRDSGVVRRRCPAPDCPGLVLGTFSEPPWDTSVPQHGNAGSRNDRIRCRTALWGGPVAPPRPRSPQDCTWGPQWAVLCPSSDAPLGASRGLPASFGRVELGRAELCPLLPGGWRRVSASQSSAGSEPCRRQGKRIHMHDENSKRNAAKS